jgi:serine protease Do
MRHPAVRAACAAACAIILSSAAPAAAQFRLFEQPDGPGSTIGATVADLSADEATKAKVAAGGVRIEQVQEGSPAARAGVRAGDVVVEFDGERVRSVRQFVRVVRETPPNRGVQAIIVRDGARQTLTVTPELGPATSQPFTAITPQIQPFRSNPPAEKRRVTPFTIVPAPGPQPQRLGASVIDLDTQLASYFGVTDGVLVTSVAADTLGASAGLRAGDVITSVGGRTVGAPADIVAALSAAKPGSALEIQVTRDKKNVTLKATLPETARPQPSGAGRIAL